MTLILDIIYMNQSIANVFENQSQNLFGLYIFCSNKNNMFLLFRELNIIEDSCQCTKCETETSNIHNSSITYFNMLRYCTLCRIHFSLFHITILTRALIDPL